MTDKNRIPLNECLVLNEFADPFAGRQVEQTRTKKTTKMCEGHGAPLTRQFFFGLDLESHTRSSVP